MQFCELRFDQMKKDEDKEGYLLRKSKLRGNEKITVKCIRITSTVNSYFQNSVNS